MRFDGLIVTDALDMNGVAARFSPGEVAVRAILAGADVLLIPPSPDAALAALYEAVESGRLSIARVDASVKRILRAKAKLGLHTEYLVDVVALTKNFAQREFATTSQSVADRGVTLLRDQNDILPLDATRPLRILLVAIAGDADYAPAEFLERDLRWRADSLQVVHVDTRYSTASLAKIPATETYDVIIAALLVRVADRKDSVSLPPDQSQIVENLFQVTQAGDRSVLRQPLFDRKVSASPDMDRCVQHRGRFAASRRPGALRRNRSRRKNARQRANRETSDKNRRWAS